MTILKEVCIIITQCLLNVVFIQICIGCSSVTSSCNLYNAVDKCIRVEMLLCITNITTHISAWTVAHMKKKTRHFIWN